MTNKRSFAVFLWLMIVLGGEAVILDVNDATNGQFPWAASVRVDNVHSCAGSIIHEHFVITAARCVSTLDNYRLSVRVGSINQFAGGQLVKVQSVFVHPSSGNFLHDVALLKMAVPFTFNEKINKIDLTSGDDTLTEATQVFATGWGLQDSGLSYNLRYLSLAVLGQEECERQAGYGYDSVICLSHPATMGICHGDEGAGIVSETKLVAVASFYFGNCGTKYPDVSSSISYYNTWIEFIIKNN